MKEHAYLWITVTTFIVAMLGVHFWAGYTQELEFKEALGKQVAEVQLLEQTLRDISTESEQLQALFRKIDGAQSTKPKDLEATTAAIDAALEARGLTNVDELRAHMNALDSMYRATTEQLQIAKDAIPKRENLNRRPQDRMGP